jgi:hypothetical protein
VTDLVEAGQFGNRVEADLARLFLESEGVHAVLFDTEVSNFYGFFAAPFMPIRLMVLDEDYELARELLAKDSPT